jgi:CubicO group peptidase (beta-lactamase class C family)
MRTPTLTGLLAVALTFLTTVALPRAAVAASPAAATSCPTASSPDLAAFFDGALPSRLTEAHVPGAVVSVIADGTTAFSRGYGLADAGARAPFDPARSLVRIASITKLFTWTAVMQQVQAGRLDLDADVNTYLTAFKVPATFDQPVTLRTLMDHTAGFEYSIIGTGARTAADVPPLGDYLAAHMPARIRPPGQVSAYENYGAGLAGYIVSRVTGEPYDEYVQTHILDPLGMRHTTATEPVPATLAGGLARSYDSDTAAAVPFTFDMMAPDGSISATADDMARFMTAQLSDDGSGILSGQTMALMQQRTFAADQRLDGYAHGFMDRTINGHRVLAHDGNWEGFLSTLFLVPDCGLGLFMSANGTGGVDALSPLIPQFFNRFAPESASAAPRAAGPASPLPRTTPEDGFYKPARHNESGVEKLVSLLGPLRLRVDTDGTVHFRNKDWTPRDDGLFEATDGSDHLVFLAGSGGVVYAAIDGPTYELMPATETLPVNLAVVCFILLAALSALALPVAALVRRLRRQPRPSTGWRLARGLTSGAVGLAVVFLGLLLVQLIGDTSDFLYGVPLGFALLLILPIAVMVAAGAGLVVTVLTWRSPGVGLTAQIHQVTLFLAIGAFAAFCGVWNLFGWQYS